MARTIKDAVPEDLTPDELAAELRISKATAANWRYQGIGPKFYKLTEGRGGRVRYPRQGVSEWRAERAGGAAA